MASSFAYPLPLSVRYSIKRRVLQEEDLPVEIWRAECQRYESSYRR